MSNKTITLRFRCTETEAEQIRELAENASQTVSEYIRSKILTDREENKNMFEEFDSRISFHAQNAIVVYGDDEPREVDLTRDCSFEYVSSRILKIFELDFNERDAIAYVSKNEEYSIDDLVERIVAKDADGDDVVLIIPESWC